jgi:hypothetical protein
MLEEERLKQKNKNIFNYENFDLEQTIRFGNISIHSENLSNPNEEDISENDTMCFPSQLRVNESYKPRASPSPRAKEPYFNK